MPRKPAGRILRIQPGSGRGSIAKERASRRRLLTCSAWAGVVALSELALRGAFRVVDQQ
jgi:hypothetical protein